MTRPISPAKALSGPSPACSTHGREERADQLRLVARLEPGAARAERFAKARRKAARAAPPAFLQQQRCSAARPQRAAEHGEEERRIAIDHADVGAKTVALAGLRWR